jgi:hypothetical protein
MSNLPNRQQTCCVNFKTFFFYESVNFKTWRTGLAERSGLTWLLGNTCLHMISWSVICSSIYILITLHGPVLRKAWTLMISFNIEPSVAVDIYKHVVNQCTWLTPQVCPRLLARSMHMTYVHHSRRWLRSTAAIAISRRIISGVWQYIWSYAYAWLGTLDLQILETSPPSLWVSLEVVASTL